jgi:hypothetical protein
VPKKEKVKEKPKKNLISDDEVEGIEEEKMNFEYDEYRKKYTVKAEEIEEEDFIEDNYEDGDF